MNDIKFTAKLEELAAMLKVPSERIAKFVIFDDRAISHVIDLFKSNQPRKDQIDWCFLNARSYSDQHGMKPDWSMYEIVKKRFATQPTFKKEIPSKGNTSRKEDQRQQNKEHMDAYKLKCEKRSLEYMQQPGSKQKAAEYGKSPFFDGMKPTESHHLSYEDMSESYITMMMVKHAGREHVAHIPEISDEMQNVPGNIGNETLFSDGQPIKPDYQAIFDQLDEVDDSQFEPTELLLNENSSQNQSNIANLLRQTGLF